jgi:hypothetical protein
MDFVGRQREIARIRKDLERGDNVIVCGKYGIGRTSLLKHIATLTQAHWRFVFVDFSQPSSAVCRDLFAQLFPKLRDNRKGKYISYKSSRFQIVHLELQDDRQHVLVLDNIGKLSAQKLNLLQYLAREKRFRLVAIVENFLPADQFRRLRTRLSPSSIVTLDHLNVHSIRKFFSSCSEQYGFGWTVAQVNSKATTTGGYPLGMKDAVMREIERRRSCTEAERSMQNVTAGAG